MKIQIGEIYWIAGHGPAQAVYWPTMTKNQYQISFLRPTQGIYWANPEQISPATKEILQNYIVSLQQACQMDENNLKIVEVVSRWIEGKPLKQLYVVIPNNRSIHGDSVEADTDEEALELFNQLTHNQLTMEEVEFHKVENSSKLTLEAGETVLGFN